MKAAMTSVPDAPEAVSATTTRPSSIRWRVIALVGVLTVINLADRTSLSVGMPVIAQDLGLSPAIQGVMLSAFFWSYALCQVPGGWLIDRMGPSRIIAGSTLLWGVFQTLAAGAFNGLSLLLTRIGLGVAEAPLFPAAGKLNALWLAPTERARGAVLMDSGSYLGAGVGGAVIALLIAGFDSWRAAFAIAGVVTIAIGIFAWWYLQDDPARHSGVNEGELAVIRADAGQRAALGEGVRAKLGADVLAPVMIGRFGWASINFGLLTWGPSYLAQARGFDLKAMGWSTLVIFGSGFIGALVSGFLADFLQRKGWRRDVALKLLLTLSGLATLVAFVVLPTIEAPVSAVLVLAFTYFMLCFGSLYWSLPAMLAPAQSEGFMGGMMNCAGSVGGIIVPLVAGVLLEVTGTFTAVLTYFAISAGLYVLATLFIPFVRRAEARP
ncbi:MFS transporter [Marinivivus vitaminiproducens]|uniref:MFS transporter n=1 Tax=Marinivivus vitaminiproducens TaxID=3035935 RepID=UPI00279A5696|nr:MFS transporter [Geminicoccaceae bacterium SCSIO 64248]